MSWEPPFSTGTECAEPTGLRRLLRHPSAKRNLTIAAAVLGAAVLLLPRGAGGMASSEPSPIRSVDPSPWATEPADASRPEPIIGTPVIEGDEAGAPVTAAATPLDTEPGRGVYAIYLYKLPGLSPDATPGTELDIWVTWKPPLTRQPRVQLLLEGVELGAIETGFEQGAVADLLVDHKQIPDLIYGERFGSLTAVASA